MTKRKIEYWVIPPESDAEFVANMENVLETYETPYDSKCPVICMDEQPVQLVKETRQPIPATKSRARRVDYEYERAGTASIFMFTEPLSGLASGDRPQASNESGLGAGNGLSSGRSLRQLRKDHPGLRQPQHAHQRSILRNVRTSEGPAH